MEGSIWRTFVTISLMMVIGLFVATPPAYGYNYPEMVEWTEEDAAFLFIDNPINLAEMKRALWYKEQFYALADYVEKIEVALETTMEERDEAWHEKVALTSRNIDLESETNDLRESNAVLRSRINRLLAGLGSAVAALAVYLAVAVR